MNHSLIINNSESHCKNQSKRKGERLLGFVEAAFVDGVHASHEAFPNLLQHEHLQTLQQVESAQASVHVLVG